jgi:hypothetical protein
MSLEKLTNDSKGKPVQKFDMAFGITFRISKCSQRSKQKLHIDFSLELSRLEFSKCSQRSKQKLHIDFSLELSRLKNLKTICSCQESTALILLAFKKKYSTGNIPVIPLTPLSVGFYMHFLCFQSEQNWPLLTVSRGFFDSALIAGKKAEGMP